MDFLVTELNTLTAAGLEGASVAILASVNNNSGGITALTADEQAALGTFVQNGGCAILFADNSAFAGGASDAINESLIDPFGFDIVGNYVGVQTATTNGTSFTTGVSSFTGYYTGHFDGIDAASVLATWNVNSQPALLEKAVGGGRVIAFSDANVFFGAQGSTWVQSGDNRQLFLNAVNSCLE